MCATLVAPFGPSCVAGSSGDLDVGVGRSDRRTRRSSFLRDVDPRTRVASEGGPLDQPRPWGPGCSTLEGKGEFADVRAATGDKRRFEDPDDESASIECRRNGKRGLGHKRTRLRIVRLLYAYRAQALHSATLLRGRDLKHRIRSVPYCSSRNGPARPYDKETCAHLPSGCRRSSDTVPKGAARFRNGNGCGGPFGDRRGAAGDLRR